MASHIVGKFACICLSSSEVDWCGMKVTAVFSVKTQAFECGTLKPSLTAYRNYTRKFTEIVPGSAEYKKPVLRRK